MPTVEEVGEKIRASIRAARKAGFVIAPKRIRSELCGQRQCCAVGAVVHDLPVGSMFYDEACSRLGLSIGEAACLTSGFDCSEHETFYTKWYDLGAVIRREVETGEL
jgi:PIN domain nuclease of toxin-antitoxin system